MPVALVVQSITPSFIAWGFFCCASLGQCQDASVPKPMRGEETVPLVEYLGRIGVKLDCYFTIEEMHLDVDNWIEQHQVQAGNEPSTIDKMVKQLSAQLKGVHVYRSKENPVVVHFTDERLEKEKDYPLGKQVAIRFCGSPGELVIKLQTTSLKNLHNQMVFAIDGWPQDSDYCTKIQCSTPGALTRRVLTDCLPLSQYNRLLWIAGARRIDGNLDTSVVFYGRFPSTVDKEKSEESGFDIARRQSTG